MKAVINIVIAILMIVATDCAAGNDIILEYKDVQSFKLIELPDRPGHGLKISGLAFHSALSVDKMTTETVDTALIIYIHLVPAKPGLSGSFEYELTVPDSIREVRFGRERVVIWKRK